MNINELIDELSSVFKELKTGEIEPRIAQEMNNSAGKIMNAAKLQLEYAGLIKETPDIKFLKNEEQVDNLKET